MEIDYINMRDLVEVRLKQIDDASKDNPYFNKEYKELKTISESISNLIILERKSVEHYNDNFGEIPIRSRTITAKAPIESPSTMIKNETAGMDV